MAARSADPSRTKTIRQTYARRLRGGFERINTVIHEAVSERDIFGLGDGELLAATPPPDFQFARDDQKVEGFTNWLERAQDDEVLEIIDRNDNQYIRHSYHRGTENAHRRLREQGVDVPRDVVSQLVDTPVHREKLQSLYTRNFRELKGITEAVDQQVSRELTEALLEGTNPNETARRIADRVDSIGKNRATVLARTETLNAHNEASLTRYEQVLGSDAEVSIEAEILTAQDSRVCSICEPKHGSVMPIKQARQNGPPYHPMCRCVVSPVVDN